ncbi:hypothetical protein Hypma_002727 [Hypsizygus marmoreus]|uniref:Uncharacterized protein n=1 Tax=Hypsizygus marmoreus TaxID=39966 RepID=A0A369JCB4_HYPMA|nr:hypothetical protein Hypma_002727 [Hypsizygus marmoreus]
MKRCKALKREPANEFVKLEVKKVAALLEKKSQAFPNAPPPGFQKVISTHLFRGGGGSVVDDQSGSSTSTPSSSQPQQSTRIETAPLSPPSSKPILSGSGDPLKAVSTRSLKPAESFASCVSEYLKYYPTATTPT